jgi:predicted small lipoprotein YifL
MTSPAGSLARRGATLGLLLAFGLLAGCGQRGPLTLPASARPIERLEPGATAAPADEESPNEERSENER